MSTDTPTPRTDAAALAAEDFERNALVVGARTARQLERDLTAANARHDALVKRLESLCEQWEESARKQAILKSGGLYLFTAKELRAAINP